VQMASSNTILQTIVTEDKRGELSSPSTAMVHPLSCMDLW
jgi:hypothetical protein